MQRRIRYFEMQCERHPRSLHFLALADLHRRAGDPARAVELLEAGLTRCGASISGHLLLGQSRLDLDQPDKAAAHFERVLELDPEHGHAAQALARCRPAEGEDAVADVASSEASEPAPESTAAAATPESEPTSSEPELPAEDEPGPDTEPIPSDEEVDAEETGPEIEAEPVDGPDEDAPSAVQMEPLPAAADSRQAEPLPSLFVTRTLSDIYLSQGHKDKALRILYQILANHPEREDIVARIAELEGGDPTASDDAAASAPAARGETEPDNRRRFDAWVDRAETEPAEDDGARTDETRVEETRGGD